MSDITITKDRLSEILETLPPKQREDFSIKERETQKLLGAQVYKTTARTQKYLMHQVPDVRQYREVMLRDMIFQMARDVHPLLSFTEHEVCGPIPALVGELELLVPDVNLQQNKRDLEKAVLDMKVGLEKYQSDLLSRGVYGFGGVGNPVNDTHAVLIKTLIADVVEYLSTIEDTINRIVEVNVNHQLRDSND